MWLKTGKNFNEIFRKPITQLSVWTAYDYLKNNMETQILNAELKETYFVDEVETQLREKPLRGSQTRICTIQKTKLDIRQ
jgi:hypothetical protein